MGVEQNEVYDGLHIENIDQRFNDFGNDEDIYEMERLKKVCFKNEVQFKEDSSSISLNSSSLNLNQDQSKDKVLEQFNSNEVKVGVSSLKTLIKQKSVRDLKLEQVKFNEFKMLQPIESEIQDEDYSNLN